MARLTQQSLDDAFARGGSATDAYENVKKRQQVTQEGQAERDAKIAQLIKGDELKQQAIGGNLRRAQEYAAAHGMDPRKISINASESHIGVNPENEGIMTLLGIKDRQEARQDKAVERLGGTLGKSSYPEMGAAVGGLADSMNKHGGVKVGPISGSTIMPASVVQVGEQLGGAAEKAFGSRLGLPEEGATEQKQRIEELKGFQRHKLYGAALTAQEKQAYNDAMGLLTAGSPEQRQDAIERLAELYNKGIQNIQASYGPDVVGQYKKQGGMSLDPIQIPRKGGAADPKSRLEMLREKRRRGEI